MLKFLKWTKILFWWGLITLTVSSIVFVSVYNYYKFPSMDEIQHYTNISDEYPRGYRKAAMKSRASAVMIVSGDLFFRGISRSSGMYFIADGVPYVITTAHGIIGPCFLTAIVHEEESYACEDYMIIDREVDYAIIKLQARMLNRVPVQIPGDLPVGTQWKNSYSLLNKIIYTGYPNIIGPLTLKGDVVGYTGDNDIYIFSYAYGGSSGSGVFSVDGKYIGIVAAVDVGETSLGYDVLENIVIVTPSYKVDWSAVLY